MKTYDSPPPAVSVVMCIYNSPDYLAQAIQSVLDSSFGDFELLLIDDGSTDSSSNICRDFADRDARIIYYHKDNGGIASARNAGLAQARGAYVFFMDADDYLHEDMIRCLYQTASEKGSDICGCSWYAVKGADCTVTTVASEDVDIKGPQSNRELARYLLASGFIPAGCCSIKSGFLNGVIWNNIYRRQFILDHGLSFFCFWNNEDDWIFNISCYMNAELSSFIAKPLYYYRVQQTSLSRKKRYIEDIYRRRCQGAAWIHAQLDACCAGHEKEAAMYKGILQRRIILYTLYNETSVKKRRTVPDGIAYIRHAVMSEKVQSISSHIYLQAGLIEKLYIFLLLHHGVIPAYLLNRYIIKKYR